jgi:hypothetical protein
MAGAKAISKKQHSGAGMGGSIAYGQRVLNCPIANEWDVGREAKLDMGDHEIQRVSWLDKLLSCVNI